MLKTGFLIFEGDSGDPVDIVCGTGKPTDKWYNNLTEDKWPPQCKGLIQHLWEIFGGTINNKGYKVLDSHIGAIYGDAITIDRQTQILEKLKNKGFAANNIVFGIGSYTYQYNTRDTHGGAVKATYVEIDGKGKNIFKEPKTAAWKKSHKGLLRLNEDMSVEDSVSWKRQGGILEPVFSDGKLIKEYTLDQIRHRINEQTVRENQHV